VEISEPRGNRSWRRAIGVILGAAVVAGAYTLSSPDRSTANRNPPAGSAVKAPPSPTVEPSARPVLLTIDLRHVGARNTASARTASLALPRRRLHATIFLPPGCAAGKCEIEIRDSAGLARKSMSGHVTLIDGRAVLRSTLDLSGLPSGPYRLALRQEGQDWMTVPVHLTK